MYASIIHGPHLQNIPVSCFLKLFMVCVIFIKRIGLRWPWASSDLRVEADRHIYIVMTALAALHIRALLIYNIANATGRYGGYILIFYLIFFVLIGCRFFVTNQCRRELDKRLDERDSRRVLQRHIA